VVVPAAAVPWISFSLRLSAYICVISGCRIRRPSRRRPNRHTNHFGRGDNSLPTEVCQRAKSFISNPYRRGSLSPSASSCCCCCCLKSVTDDERPFYRQPSTHNILLSGWLAYTKILVLKLVKSVWRSICIKSVRKLSVILKTNLWQSANLLQYCWVAAIRIDRTAPGTGARW